MLLLYQPDSISDDDSIGIIRQNHFIVRAWGKGESAQVYPRGIVGLLIDSFGFSIVLVIHRVGSIGGPIEVWVRPGQTVEDRGL